MSKFKECLLEDFISPEKRSLISGPFGSNISKKFFQPDGVPVIRGNNLSTGFIKFIDDGFVYVTEEKAKSLNTYAILDDLVFTAVGTLGQVGLIHKDLKYKEYIISNKQLRVRLDKEALNPIYAFYWFSSSWMVETIKKRNVGSTVPLINLTITRGLPVRVPELFETQKQIAKVLSDLDAKIEVNNNINQELEAMAKTLYDYWFVQFDFPDANGKPYRSSGGKMVFNEALKREIPEGWEDGVLSDIANITMGQSPSGSSYNEDGEGTVFYQGSTDFGSRFPTVRKYTTEPSRMAEANDILLSVRAPVGTLNQAMESCCIGRGLAALREKEGSISFLWSQMEYFKQIFDRRNSSGTTFGSITKDDLFNLKLCIPNENVLQKFKKIADPFHDKIVVNSKQNQKLSELRDWLLPMLMNGQVTVTLLRGTKQSYDEVLVMVAEDKETYKTK